MFYALSVFGVFAVQSLMSTYITAPKWFWVGLPVALGIGSACLIDLSRWWLGIGVAGAAMFVKVAEALLLMLTDYVMIEIQRGGRLRR